MHEFMTGIKRYLHCKNKVDKVMASVKKGVKYMVIISLNTNVLYGTLHITESYKQKSQSICLFVWP